MRSVKDLIHDHPLNYHDGDHDEEPKSCNLCGLLMFTVDNPFYSCSNITSCMFFLHQYCADLPETFLDDKSFSSIYGHFVLLSSPRSKGCRCLKCGQICENYTYCPQDDDYEHIGLHPLCALPNKMETRHGSHHHPLTLTRMVMSTLCSACGEEEKGLFFSCQLCNYWIHQNCASLSSVVQCESHPHALVRKYYRPDPISEFSWGSCRICHGDMPLRHGCYNCLPCDYYVHLKCGDSSKKVLTPEELKKLIFRLPSSKADSTSPSLIIRAASLEVEKIDGEESEKMALEECHDHPLSFHDGDADKAEVQGEAGLCNACIQPISSSAKYYSCSENECHFLVHEICTNLRPTLWGKILDRPMRLFPKWTDRFFHTFYCSFCKRQCNGFGYSFKLGEEDDESTAFVDVECASAPRIVRYESHKDHILQLKTSIDTQSEVGLFNCCSRIGWYFRRRFYQCVSCTFKIHISCALLPQHVKHRFDEHDIRLNTDGPAILESLSDDCELKDRYFCEFCEEGIDLKYWFYCCDECDQYFHVDCIPSLGILSKFKFGGTIHEDTFHPHPLASVRMLTIGSQYCGFCKVSVQGFEDDFAFHCSTCDFWVHPFCLYIWKVIYK